MSFLKGLTYRPLLIVLLVVCNALSVQAQAPPMREYQIKSAFLFNFSQFVQWPETAFADAESPFVIGVLGEDPFGAYLSQVVAGEQVNGRKLVVRHFNSADDVQNCQILFLNLGSGERTESVLENLQGRSILTVSDNENFIRKGGMVRFVTVDKKIRFQINPEQATVAGLSISSKLLRLSEIVTIENRR